MILLFIKGQRGLMAQSDGKMYFPDRKSDIKSEGVYECEISIDKETYAFVSGEKIQIENDLGKILNVVSPEILYQLANRYCHLEKIGDSSIIFVINHWLFKMICVDTNGNTIEICTETGCPGSKFIYRTDPDKIKYNESEFTIQFIKYQSEIVDVDKQLRVAIGLYRTYYRFYTDNRLDIYDDKFFKFRDSDSIRYMVCDRLFETYEKDLIKSYTTKRTISFDNIVDYMIEHKIGFGDSKSNICKYHISVFGTAYEFKFLNAANAIRGYSEKDLAEVEESWRELEALRKRIRKNITKSNIDVMRRLTDKAILNIEIFHFNWDWVE